MGTVFVADHLDDLMRKALGEIRQHGIQTLPRRGLAREVQALTLVLTNPRARLSRTESRGRLASTLGEFCWYLAGSDDLGFIRHYVRDYPTFHDAVHVPGAYGPRLFRFDGVNQIQRITEMLQRNPWTRRAVIQLLDHEDLLNDDVDVPCTCALQFLLREQRLQLIVFMRSNDAYLGLPHDVFSFTMIQEVVARSIGMELGPYTHIVGSFHLYDADSTKASRYLKEGWQSRIEMPAMPLGDPWPAIHSFLAEEESIRSGSGVTEPSALPRGYWGDLASLLRIHALMRTGDENRLREAKKSLTVNTYDALIDDRVDRSQQRR